MRTPQLDHCMSCFFIDDQGSHNQAIFGMRLQERDIPVYKREENIKGLTYEHIKNATSS